MRSLIQPALFAFARLGLFLSVMAWVVGQWWYIEITLDQTSHGFELWDSGVILRSDWIGKEQGGFGADTLSEPGQFFGGEWPIDDGTHLQEKVVFVREAELGTLPLKQTESDKYDGESNQLTLVVPDGPPASVLKHESSFVRVDVDRAGLLEDFTVSQSDPDLWSMPGVASLYSQIKFDHWFVVSILTLINVALWWYYRKPKEGTPCES